MKTTGMKLVSTVGGASGPLYGTMFMQMGNATAGKMELTLDDWIAAMQAGLSKAGLQRIVVIPLGGEPMGINVAKLYVPGLEDRLTNTNWRPGSRATAAMLGFL